MEANYVKKAQEEIRWQKSFQVEGNSSTLWGSETELATLRNPETLVTGSMEICAG